jgi:CBS domain containing-hemolysin-like protein
VDAKTSIEDIEDELNLKIEDGPYDTIGGFIIKELGRMPEKGELIEIDGFKVTVNEIYEKGIKNLIIKKMADKNM